MLDCPPSPPRAGPIRRHQPASRVPLDGCPEAVFSGGHPPGPLTPRAGGPRCPSYYGTRPTRRAAGLSQPARPHWGNGPCGSPGGICCRTPAAGSEPGTVLPPVSTGEARSVCTSVRVYTCACVSACEHVCASRPGADTGPGEQQVLAVPWLHQGHEPCLLSGTQLCMSGGFFPGDPEALTAGTGPASPTVVRKATRGILS